MPLPRLAFEKIDTLGNDYLYLYRPPSWLIRRPTLIRLLSDRHRGAGSDGLIGIYPSRRADFLMRMWNSDGSEGRMCGNGLRGAACFAWNHGLIRRRTLTFETRGGLFPLAILPRRDGSAFVTVRMGSPRFLRRDIPATGDPSAEAWDLPLRVGNHRLRVHALSFGNPHCVVSVPAAERFPVAEVGPLLERHPLFPDRANVEFITVLSRRLIRQRTWERGSGETLACGSGACAAAVAAHRLGQVDSRVVVRLSGGDLAITLDRDGAVSLAGPARPVYSGTFLLPRSAPR